MILMDDNFATIVAAVERASDLWQYKKVYTISIILQSR